MPSMQSLDISSARPPRPRAPGARLPSEPVAKLIDISKCIGCKACQVACMQWNDLRDDIGTTVGVYDNPNDLTDQSWTLMRFAEVSRRPDGRADGVADPQGRLHALRRSGLPEGVPGARRDRQVRQRHRRFHLRELHRLRLLHRRLPVRHSAHQQEGQQGLQVLVVFGSRRCGARAGLRQDLSDRRAAVRHQERHGQRAARNESSI